MKSILCYGDSNTYGIEPGTGMRYPGSIRWPGVLQSELGSEYLVIEEGLPGRTSSLDDPQEGGRNGLLTLNECLERNEPVDLVVLMLGTNDLKQRFSSSAQAIAESLHKLVCRIQESQAGPGSTSPLVLLIAPPLLCISNDQTFHEVYEGAIKKSVKLSEALTQRDNSPGIYFLDSGKIIQSSTVDGVHLEAEEHKKLALSVSRKITEIFLD